MKKIHKWVFLLGSVVLFIIHIPYLEADVSDQQRAFELNEAGVRAMEDEKFPAAIDFFTRALKRSPKNKTIRANLATSYNNYALSLDRAGDTETAKKYLQRALEISPQDTNIRENLANIVCAYAQGFYQDGKYNLAENELREAIEAQPKHSVSLILLGQIYYQQQSLKLARDIWEQALDFDPGNPMILDLLDKIDEEYEVEKDMKYTKAYYFDIRFNKDVVDKEIYNIRSLLQEAYREIGSDLGHRPRHEIPVILYSPEEFQLLRDTPDWVDGLYDGKIRLPIKEDTLSGNEIKRLIWHEYTHAVVYDLCNNHCPIWFNEGLAKWEEAKQVPVDLRPLKTALKNNELIPLNELGSYFTMDADVDKLNLAYLEAYSFIEFIVKEWDLFRLRKILREFKKEKSAGKAFARVLYRSMEKMNSEWLEFLRKKYK